MIRRVHRLTLPLVFPAGIAPGEGDEFNTLTIARNGAGRPVLRGTALAGALRHAWSRRLSNQGLRRQEVEARVKAVFGFALTGDDGGQESRLQVADCVLALGQGLDRTQRTHHLRNRHTGVVADGGLFSLEACPPGTSTLAVLWLRDGDEDSAEAARELLQTFARFFASGITLGGKTARGIGRAELEAGPTYRAYDLTQLDSHAQFLDDHRRWRANPLAAVAGEAVEAKPDPGKRLEIRASLVIPRGQDLLVGDGRGLAHESEPQRILAADGKWYWRLPGASLRGLFRGWIAKLAAREGHPVADSAKRHADRQQRLRDDEPPIETDELNGDNLGWCFLPRDDRQHGIETTCPVASLFGSLFQAGRIHIADSFSPCSTPKDGRHAEEQTRMHVAVDRITGGAAESLLFDNTVLTADAHGRSPRFEVLIQVREPTENDARWLAKTLRALHVGVLRVGSSKSSGRLELAEPPRAEGEFAELFRK